MSLPSDLVPSTPSTRTFTLPAPAHTLVLVFLFVLQVARLLPSRFSRTQDTRRVRSLGHRIPPSLPRVVLTSFTIHRLHSFTLSWLLSLRCCWLITILPLLLISDPLIPICSFCWELVVRNHRIIHSSIHLNH